MPTTGSSRLDAILVAGAVATALYAIYRFAVVVGSGMKTAAEWVGGIVRREMRAIVDEKVEDRFCRIDDQLSTIVGQVTSNGGTSLKDQVSRIDEALADHLSDHP